MTGYRPSRTSALTVAALTSALSISNAAADELIARGRAVAEAHCGICHAIGVDDETPTRVNANTAFRMLHERYPIAMLVEAAKTGSIAGHDEMPGFDFPVEDARALLAYIDSFTPNKQGYVTAPGGP